eukprot:gnl/MRDRNA2_/MRDRNA2_36267_c0_seq2.p1 gnl/MRDRNA2_/MRDRNA2_36267_c0~~gnl/MRDRNA2_/MRDRNA2_36267_c0_seq2.p1  ORF type:complete len:158 (+),score=30.41 gnl/MRDRNA2_/MRDRNA2_36267_c0_seq2:47-520(+)
MCQSWLLILILALDAMGVPAVDTQDPLAVLQVQMDDMQRSSTLVAYQLASPGNRAATARPGGHNKAAFDAMVRSPTYAPLLGGHGYKILSSQAADSQFTATVRVYRDAAKNRAVDYMFGMSLQHKVVDTDQSLSPYQLLPGHAPVWRTDSVVPTGEL